MVLWIVPYAEGDTGTMKSPPRAVGRIAEDYGNSMRTRIQIVEDVDGIGHHVHDVRIVERDRLSDRGQIAVEKNVVVVARGGFTHGAPDDGHLGTGQDGPPSRLHDLDVR